MKKFQAGGKRGRTILSLALLALLCIGTAELVASYFFAPDLFRAVTAPARAAASAAADTGERVFTGLADWGRQATDSISAWWEDVTATPASSLPPDGQLAGEPELVSDKEILDPAVTELRTVDGTACLTGGVYNLHYFNQTEEPWASQPYGTDKIGPYGCGPTAMAIAVNSMAGYQTDPAQMAQWAYEQGYWASQSGSYLSIVEGTAQAHGLHARPIRAYTEEAVRETLLAGDILVALMGPGHFTKSGHFILLRGLTLSGSLLVADPASIERSLTEWDIQLVLDELSDSTSNGAPLWVLSQHP